MNAKAEVASSSLDAAKLILAAVLLVGGIYGFYYFEEHSLLLRVLALLVVLGVATAIALQSTQGRAIWRFSVDARTELRKVVWPSRQETIQTTLVVMALVLLMGVFMWAVDWVLFAVVKALIGHGS